VRILADLDALQRTMNDIRLTHIGQIRVGSTSTQIVPGLFDHVTAFQADRPGISVRIVETAGSRSLIEMLGNGDVDAAFVVASEDDLNDSRIRFYPLVTGHMALLVGASHPLATHDAARLTEVSDAAFVFPGRSLSIHTLALRLCRESGFEPKIVCECDQVDTMIGFVAAGRGIGFVSSQSITDRPLPGVVALPLDPPVRRMSCLAVATDKLHDPLVAQFCAFLLDALSPV
jgi:DNA-binding transcriptional LysR family regulator